MLCIITNKQFLRKANMNYLFFFTFEKLAYIMDNLLSSPISDLDLISYDVQIAIHDDRRDVIPRLPLF